MTGEMIPEYFDRYYESPEVRLQNLLTHVEGVAQLDESSKQSESSMARTIECFYSDEPKMRETLELFTRVRSDLSVTQSWYMVRSAVLKFGLRKRPHFVPGRQDEQFWHEVVTDIFENPESIKEMTDDLLNNHLQTNIADRYKTVSITANWMRQLGRLGTSVYLLDFGSSRNLGLKALAYNEHNPAMNHKFGDTVFVDPATKSDSSRRRIDSDPLIRGAQPIPNLELTEKINRIQNTPFGLRLAQGFDLSDIEDPRSREWAFANLTPHEHETATSGTWQRLDRSYNQVSQTVRPAVVFQQRDLIDEAQSKFLEVSPADEQQYDIVSIITMLNQLSGEQRYKLVRRARRYAKPTGVVLIQDFARPMPETAWNLEFMDSNWNEKYTYRTMMIDMMEPKGFQEIMLINGGRAQKIHVRMGRAATMATKPGIKNIDLRTFIEEY